MLPIVFALAQFAAQIAQWIGGGRAEQVAQKVVTIAQTVTGTSTPEQTLAAIQTNSELAHQFQKLMVESQGKLQCIAAELEKASTTANVETAKMNVTERANARRMTLTAQGRIPRNPACLCTSALFFVTDAHFWLSFSRTPVKTLDFGVFVNIKGVVIEMNLGEKIFSARPLRRKSKPQCLPASRPIRIPMLQLKR